MLVLQIQKKLQIKRPTKNSWYVVMELRLECPSWVRVVLVTFPPITVRVRMEGLVGISLGLPPGIPTDIKIKK